MKQLTCEMCGSTDLVKQDGVFVCQSCGCKYSTEEARKMMVEGTVEVAGTVKVDNTELITNYIQMADNALESGNHSEAENYANKVIELEPNSYRAWLIKGIASGWQTTGGNNRFPESITSWINAFQNAPDEEKAALENKITESVVNIGAAIVQMHCKNFENHAVKSSREKVIDSVTMLQNQLDMLKDKTGIDVFNDAFCTILARMLNSAAVNASESADKEFGPEESDKSKFAWERFLEKQDSCLLLFNTAEIIGSDDDLCFTICNNYLALAPKVRDSCSYKYYSGSYGGSYGKDYSLTDSAKESRNKSIEEMRTKQAFYDPKKRKKDYDSAVKICDESIGSLEIDAARREYWNEHAEEKKALEDEKSRIEKQIEEKNNAMKNSPLHEEAKSKENSISSMQSELRGLGLFKGKEKKALQEKIDEAQRELSSIKEKIKDEEERVESDITPLRGRINEIEEELNKERGRSPMQHGKLIELFAGDGEGFTMSPRDLYNHLFDRIPHPYRMETGEADIKNQDKLNFLLSQISASLDALMGKGGSKKKEEYVDDPTVTKQYSMWTFNDEKEGDSKAGNIKIWCYAKSQEAPMEKSIQFSLGPDFTSKEAAAYANFVSTALFDMLPSTEMKDLQKVILAGVYGMTETKKVAVDGAIIRFMRGKNCAHTEITKNQIKQA